MPFCFLNRLHWGLGGLAFLVQVLHIVEPRLCLPCKHLNLPAQNAHAKVGMALLTSRDTLDKGASRYSLCCEKSFLSSSLTIPCYSSDSSADKNDKALNGSLWAMQWGDRLLLLHLRSDNSCSLGEDRVETRGMPVPCPAAEQFDVAPAQTPLCFHRWKS